MIRSSGTAKGRFLIWGSMLYLFFAFAFAQDIDLRGQLSSGFTANIGSPFQTMLNLRYLPEFSWQKAFKDKYILDLEFSLNAWGKIQTHSDCDFSTDGEVKPYRLWLRFASPQFEARVGLQKINFGSSLFLRPLMWFDRIDPRDPLQITDGVYGLLLRYYFLNNANIWLWGLYGNNETKGWETIPSDKKSLEYGGRLQLPLPRGEIAFTYHHRQMDLRKGLLPQPAAEDYLVPENRFALDGKWDWGVGLWVEGTVFYQESDLLPYTYHSFLTVGLDYTFGWGNGLRIAGEHFILENAKKLFASGEGFDFSALSFNYPLNLLDQITSIFYYDWKHQNLYSFLNWQRTYDNWRFHLIGFWNPKEYQIYQIQEENNLYAGKGFLIMVIYNY